MSNFENKINELKDIMFDFGATEDQRKTAKKAYEKIMADAIKAHIDNLDSNTEKYTELGEKLKSVIDNIKANKITEALEKVDDFVEDISSPISDQ